MRWGKILIEVRFHARIPPEERTVSKSRLTAIGITVGSAFSPPIEKAIEDGTIDEFDHKNPPLNDKVLEVIKPIYESLSVDSLLERCLGSETQNNNESLNSLIWTFAPKHIHAGPKTIEIATFFAVSNFNEGFIPILKILDVMGITIGPDANAFAARRDEARIERSELRTSEASKEGRTARLHQRTSENEHFEVEEGFLYEAEIAD
ncbi:uncharacterized protein CDAR_123881 [Caerostris darwini]|uniref:Uncharacterized protein n=1 Tax=Caerostris darwini TaxID=1538125 RepID=A0AAV4TAS2_9ARAC|nr:uncharacterized protein CDAR_123881 [Caerostris darwini]